MLEVTIHNNELIEELSQKIGLLLDTDPLNRIVATSMTAVLRKRVHEDGLDANGQPIDTYGPEYLKKRMGKPFNRTADSRMVFSLTRQMENDMKPIPTEAGWGIGYSNPFNYDKAIWNEQRENKKVLTALTVEEEDQVQQIAEDYVQNILDQL